MNNKIVHNRLDKMFHLTQKDFCCCCFLGLGNAGWCVCVGGGSYLFVSVFNLIFSYLKYHLITKVKGDLYCWLS